MRTRDHRTTRMLATGLFAVAGLGLASCGTEGPETGADVEDVTGTEAAESPTAEGSPTEGISEDVADEAADAGVAGGNAGAMAFDGDYNQSFADEAATYVGQQVTLSAEVSETISPEVFTIAGAANPLLVVEEQEIPSLDTGQVVQVTGTVQDNFDVTGVEEELGVDLPDEQLAEFQGQHYLVAGQAEVTEQE